MVSGVTRICSTWSASSDAVSVSSGGGRTEVTGEAGEGPPDGVSGEHRRLVEQLCGVAEEDLGMELRSLRRPTRDSGGRGPAAGWPVRSPAARPGLGRSTLRQPGFGVTWYMNRLIRLVSGRGALHQHPVGRQRGTHP